MSKTAIIIGGSLGGLTAANLLHRAGWDVRVYERVAAELEGRGAGIVTHPELLEILTLAGVDIDDSIGVGVQERVTLARDGSVQARRAMPQVLTAWSRLYGVLHNAFPGDRYLNGKHLASFEQDRQGVTARFDDGTEARADTLIGADGFRSTVRRILEPQTQPTYAGYVAWRGLVDEAALSDRARRDMFPYFAFGLPPKEQFIAYPVAGSNNATRAGERRFNFVWYRPADEAGTLRELLTDATGKVWHDGIPPPLIRPEVLAQTRQAARDVLAPQFAEVVEKTQSLFFQPILDLESSRLITGRVVLMGDAAFVARPHCGMGVTKAAGDALSLVRALQANSDLDEAFRKYEAARMRVGRGIVEHARALGAYMQSQLLTDRDREMAERYRSVHAVMTETATPPLHPV